MPVKTAYKAVNEFQPVTVSYTCDKCDQMFDDPHLSDAHIIKVEGGYGTTYPSDMMTIEIIICSACLLEWVDTFKHEPNYRNWMHENNKIEHCFDLEGVEHKCIGKYHFGIYPVGLSDEEVTQKWENEFKFDPNDFPIDVRKMPYNHNGVDYMLIGYAFIDGDSEDWYVLAQKCDGISTDKVLIKFPDDTYKPMDSFGADIEFA